MSKYQRVLDAHEDELVEAYSSVDADDVVLRHLEPILRQLGVPACFYRDIAECVDLFYAIAPDLGAIELGSKHEILFQFLTAFTITSSGDSLADAMDIVDIDKLVSSTHKLLKFRDHYDHIAESWDLFVAAAAPGADSLSYHLTLTDLQKIKDDLVPDKKKSMGSSFLIDMMSCGTTDDHGRLFNYDLAKASDGMYVDIKDFANILGNLGELD